MSTPKKPIKRHKSLQPLSREHHHGLLLCWKIKKGFNNKTEVARIKNYVNWFYENQLCSHFEAEEKHIFPILGNEHKLIKQALNEHTRLRSLFESETEVEENLQSITKELDDHIRFEERILFNEIQSIATESQLKTVDNIENTEHPKEEYHDPFWE